MEYKPMLAVLGNESFLSKKGYLFEPKLDGYRALCYKNNGLRFVTRNGKDVTKDYPELNFLTKINAKSAVIDGEIVVYDDEGRPNFQWLQNKSLEKHRASFVAFDILMKNGQDLTHKTLAERKVILESTLDESSFVQISFFTKGGKKLWNEMKKRKIEGVIAKAEDSTYKQKRSSDWVKIKFSNTIDCVILGYTTKKRGISSLLLGLYNDSSLKFAGKVGTGFDEVTLGNLESRFDKIKSEKPAVSGVKEKNVVWLKPKIVCEIKYSEMTRDKKFRAPVFLGLREDKDPEECTLKDQTYLRYDKDWA
jgi:bifunctional non-homologous end joining protein LigD